MAVEDGTDTGSSAAATEPTPPMAQGPAPPLQPDLALNDRIELHVRAYEQMVSRLNALDSWAYHFVALYFAFTAALMTLAGVLYFEAAGQKSEAVAVYTIQIANDFSTRTSVSLVIISLLGLLMTFWAIAMAFDYRFRSRDVFRHGMTLEDWLAENAEGCFQLARIGHGFRRSRTSVLTSVAAGLVFASFVIGWSGILVDAVQHGAFLNLLNGAAHAAADA